MLQDFIFVFGCLLIQLFSVTSSQISICNKKAEAFPVADLVSINNSWQSSSSNDGCFNTQRPKKLNNNFLNTMWQGKEGYEWILYKLGAHVELTTVNITARDDGFYIRANNISIYATDKLSLKINFTDHCEAGDYTNYEWSGVKWSHCGTSNISNASQTDHILCNKLITAKYILLKKKVWNENEHSFLNIANLFFYGPVSCNYSLHINNEDHLIDGSILTAYIDSDGDTNMTTATCQATLKNSTVIQLNNNTRDFKREISSSWNEASITCTVENKQVLQKTISVYAKPTLNITIDTKSLTNVKLIVKGKVHVYNYHLYPNADIQCFIQTDLVAKNITLTDNTTDKISNLSAANGIVSSVFNARFEIVNIESKNTVTYIKCTFNNMFDSYLHFNLNSETITTEISTNKNDKKKPLNIGLIIGVVLLMIALTVAVVTTIVAFRYRRDEDRNRQRNGYEVTVALTETNIS